MKNIKKNNGREGVCIPRYRIVTTKIMHLNNFLHYRVHKKIVDPLECPLVKLPAICCIKLTALNASNKLKNTRLVHMGNQY